MGNRFWVDFVSSSAVCWYLQLSLLNYGLFDQEYPPQSTLSNVDDTGSLSEDHLKLETWWVGTCEQPDILRPHFERAPTLETVLYLATHEDCVEKYNSWQLVSGFPMGLVRPPQSASEGAMDPQRSLLVGRRGRRGVQWQRKHFITDKSTLIESDDGVGQSSSSRFRTKF